MGLRQTVLSAFHISLGGAFAGSSPLSGVGLFGLSVCPVRFAGGRLAWFSCSCKVDWSSSGQQLSLFHMDCCSPRIFSLVMMPDNLCAHCHKFHINGSAAGGGNGGFYGVPLYHSSVLKVTFCRFFWL